MTVTATGNPPRGRPRRRGALPYGGGEGSGCRCLDDAGQAAVDPGGLGVLCLAWGALAALTVASTRRPRTRGREQRTDLDARQMYQSLADADVTVSTAYLYGRMGRSRTGSDTSATSPSPRPT